MTKLLASARNHKYLRIAEAIEAMIQDEVLNIGDRLPSVRVLSDEYGISMGTAFQAYYQLEGKGLIESRSKSGYYVRFNNKRLPSVPGISSLKPVSSEISMADIVTQVYKNVSDLDLINFSVATPPMDLLPAAKLNKSVLHAIRSSKYHGLNYEHYQGNLELRKQIVKLSFNWGGKIKPDDIIVTAGCMEALSLCLRATVKTGDAIAVESPTYFGIFQLLACLGLQAVEIPADPVNGIDVLQLEKAIRQFSVKACLFVPNFNNPVGSCMPDEKKKQLVELITRLKIPLIEDDIYGELHFGKSRPKTCKTFDKEGWVLHCTSLSKSLAPGYRIGWCIPGRFTEKIKSLKMVLTIAAPTLMQVAVAHFLSIGRYEYHMKNFRKALYKQYLRYVQSIIEHFPEDVRISRPQGGYILWIELDKRIHSLKLYHEAMKYGISIAPGQLFSSKGSYEHYFRLSFGKQFDDTIEYGIRVLGQLIRKSRL
jgi:DNA-binding transcriptional MocR family regulator